jgi:hypothetical protein
MNDHFHIVLTSGVDPACSTPQKVERQVMSDAEQPTLRVVNRPIRQARFQRAQQRFLDDVLAIER